MNGSNLIKATCPRCGATDNIPRDKVPNGAVAHCKKCGVLLMLGEDEQLTEITAENIGYLPDAGLLVLASLMAEKYINGLMNITPN